ncbi:hypothetical protein GCM10027047_13700 [Rhodococcus aerolatus]
MADDPYSSGERVFGPPRGTLDADWVATALRSHRPDLDHPTSVALARRAWDLLRTHDLRGDELSTALRDDDTPGPLAADVAAVVTEAAQLYLDRG